MYCSKCGKENQDDAAFCQGCGNAFNIQAQVASPDETLSQQIHTTPVKPQKQKKPKKPLYKRVWFWLIVVFIGIPMLNGIINGGKSTPTSTPASSSSKIESSASSKSESKNSSQESAESSEPASVFNENDYSEKIPISDLIHDADSFKGEKVKYRGTVSQKLGPTLGVTIYRIAIDGISDNMVYVNEAKDAMVDTVIDGDMVDFYGIVKGQTSYKAVLGNTIYLPEIDMQKLVKVDTASLIEYTDSPFTVTEYSYNGSVSRTTVIESVKIKSISMSYSGDMKIEMELIGTVTGYNYLSLSIKCYDVDGISLGEKSVFGSVTDGEKFRLNESVYVPAETVKIEFVHD